MLHSADKDFFGTVIIRQRIETLVLYILLNKESKPWGSSYNSIKMLLLW